MRASLARSASRHTLVWVLGSFIVVPLLYAVVSGFKTTGDLTTDPVGLPSPWKVSNYTGILSSGDFWRQIGNSVMIAVATTVLTVAAAALAAFAFARYAFRGREFFFTLFAAGLMFPPAVAVLPLFVLLRSFGLLDDPLGVILPQAAFALPITIIILRSFFRTIPAELEEAAIMDGCSRFGFFWRILLPMARPALGTVSVLAIVTSWNNFFLPLLVLADPKWQTIPVGIQQFQGQYSTNYALVIAYIVLAMVPAVAFYAVAERQLIGGLTAGATKG
ncbi:raffinose/stachyose/melibiose transport system permease protein [Actinomadura luteofluorescens]|uniref:Raffinose/stachyose/melibiose transport system permease protein n=1 Tax=Actinomadura luteofluorescens TaxID=46163 RepID=A0A7Y9JKX1_9ACTN|nr:carbohydrate ABC transporter permease [Actinomadura luteofluorescens]NYD52341.1 raffinose/stachyose/melibiose transport system permease protein [Actinomadura luteofluorescens]